MLLGWVYFVSGTGMLFLQLWGWRWVGGKAVSYSGKICGYDLGFAHRLAV